MSSVVISGDTSGAITVSAPAVAGTNTLTLPAVTDTLTGIAATQTLTNKTLTSPTLTTPALGTPASGVMTNVTGINYDGYKNRIINGAAGIWQRGTTFSSINNNITYGSDRFFAFTTGATAQAQMIRSTSVPTGFLYSQQFGRAVSNTIVNQQFLCQCIESWNMLDLVGQTVTVSFWAKAGANYSGGSLSIKLSTGTTADQSAATFSAGPCTGYTGNQAAINTTQAITTTFTKYTFTSSAIQAGALSMGLGIGYTPTGTAGADDNVYITGVQLEKGSTATSFDYRPYGTELQLCQRYYYKANSTGGNVLFGFGYNTATTESAFGISLPVTMRSIPTFTSSAAGTFLSQDNSNRVPTAVTMQTASVWAASVTFTITGATAGTGAKLLDNGAANLAFSSEL